jgi:hypothetical protein
VRDVRSDHGNIAGSQDALITVDADREFALDHRPSLLFDMLVFMDRGRARSDRVAGQRHALAMHRESLPARHRLNRDCLGRGEEGHVMRVTGPLTREGELLFSQPSGTLEATPGCKRAAPLECEEQTVSLDLEITVGLNAGAAEAVLVMTAPGLRR